MTKSANRDRYIFMVRDYLFDNKWFFPLWDTAAESAGRTTIQRKEALGVRKGLMPDGPFQLRNVAILLISKK